MKFAGAFFLALIALVTLVHITAAKDVELEGFDALDLAVDTSDGAASATVVETSSPGQCNGQCQESAPADPQPKPRAVVGGRRPTVGGTSAAQPKNYRLEAAFAVVIVLYVLVAIWGTKENGKIADAFARMHCVGEAALFPRQFALCGAGEPNAAGFRTPMLKESSSLFKFYASGRRHCQGCLATLSLRNRADLLSWVLNFFLPSEDLLEIDVYMNEANMPPMVLAVATPRQARALADRTDIRTYTKPLKLSASGPAAPTDPVPGWPGHKLQVLAEHSSLFYDLFSDPRVHSVFTSTGHADKLRLFRSLLATSENSGGSHKRLLRFVFALPAYDDMRALSPLLGLVPLLVDLVGVYKLTPELKKRALEVRIRQEVASADAEESRRRRIEALQKRKQEKAQEEKERLSRLAPEARRKAEEKLAKQAAKKSMKVKMMPSRAGLGRGQVALAVLVLVMATVAVKIAPV
ncbi:hypothetical protein VOLCADRAFT_93141 [Volvox carteri f. nagariensis]|uniref:Uncharacterized protein n=1 Tax=Volvox carteri f. nagariensis TaxID=3068 RepID=D8U1E7_VOLCA|nr:uncharacterized protein VOLCADRAFT_93141 [Volvox carteri f. nagariensis]EFJ46399.1 hypothetical protein VOLCADRAFT_93141 [Volvox carteri f. nagariensis]|eukprot:XP_002952552.1 hypothetical protein VOLCADRAFT_93141 [Volvox carteri f. nagariensis]